MLCIKALSLWISVFPNLRGWTLLGFLIELIRFSSSSFVGPLGLWFFFFPLALCSFCCGSDNTVEQSNPVHVHHAWKHAGISQVLLTVNWTFLRETRKRCGGDRQQYGPVFMSGSGESVLSSVSEQEFGSMFPALEFFPVSLRENDDRKLFITGPVSVTDLGVRLGKPRQQLYYL